MEHIEVDRSTPWRKVYAKFCLSSNFRLSRAEFSRALGCHRSKVTRKLNDDKGLIDGCDQELILTAADRLGVEITPSDIAPERV